MKSGKLADTTVKPSKSLDDLGTPSKSVDEPIPLPSFKKIKSEPSAELQSLPSFKKLKSELPDKNSQPLPSFKKLKSGEIVDDIMPLTAFKKMDSTEVVDDLLSLPSFKKLKSSESVDELLPLPSFKKLKSETAEYHARVKLAKEGGVATQSSLSSNACAHPPLSRQSSLGSSVAASSAQPPPLKVEPLDPPPQTLPSFSVVQPSQYPVQYHNILQL